MNGKTNQRIPKLREIHSHMNIMHSMWIWNYTLIQVTLNLENSLAMLSLTRQSHKWWYVRANIYVHFLKKMPYHLRIETHTKYATGCGEQCLMGNWVYNARKVYADTELVYSSRNLNLQCFCKIRISTLLISMLMKTCDNILEWNTNRIECGQWRTGGVSNLKMSFHSDFKTVCKTCFSYSKWLKCVCCYVCHVMRNY